MVLIFWRSAQDSVDIIDKQGRKGDQAKHGIEDKGVALTDLSIRDPHKRRSTTGDEKVAKNKSFDDRQKTQG